MSKKKGKGISLNFVREDTKYNTGSCTQINGGCYIAFDFDPDSRKDMVGFTVSSAKIARALAEDFSIMADVLEKRGNP